MRAVCSVFSNQIMSGAKRDEIEDVAPEAG